MVFVGPVTSQQSSFVFSLLVLSHVTLSQYATELSPVEQGCPPEDVTCFPRCKLQGSRAGNWGSGALGWPRLLASCSLQVPSAKPTGRGQGEKTD